MRDIGLPTTARFASAEGRPERKPDIQAAMDELRHAIGLLQEYSDTLFGRLAPVVRMEPDNEIGQNGIASTCELAGEIRSQMHRIERLRDQVREVLDKIEI